MRRLLWLWLLAAPANAQEDWHNLLQRVRDRVRETIQRLPNYMCTQTIDRTQYRPSSGRVPSCAVLIAGRSARNKRPAVSDRLRLDVAIADAGEMYSWVGESGFHDQSLGDLVKEGVVSTGSFSGFLRGIFASEGVSFSFKGETTEDSRQLSVFAYQVTQRTSQYSFRYRTGRMTVGYSGTFVVDPKSADLVRLVIDTDELPAYTESCQSSTTLEYGRVVLRGSDFLLPSAGHLWIIDVNGAESENRTAFSGCHEFLGESTLRFDDPEQSPSEDVKRAVAQAAFPAGLPFRLALTRDIDMATAAVGDPVHAKLTSAIQDRASKVLVPADAVVTGRIVELRHHYVPSSSWSIGLRLETLKADGSSRPFLATVDSLGQKLSGARGGKGLLRWHATPGMATIEFGELKPTEVIKAGQEMRWVTVWPSPASLPKTQAPAQTNPIPAQFRIEDTGPGAPQNLRFNDGGRGEIPPGWQLPNRSAGDSVELQSDGCKIGPRCAVVRVSNPPANSLGNLVQSFDASSYRGKIVRLHAWLRLEPAAPGSGAHMWLRVDREDGEPNIFDSGLEHSVTSAEWKECEIKGRVDDNARIITIGITSPGKGSVWIDGIVFETVP